MERLLKKYLTPILIAVSLIVGTVFGFQTASSLYLFSESISRGALAAGTLPKLEGHQNQNLRYMLETDVDDALVRYSYAEEEWWFDLYQSGWLVIIQIDNIEFDRWMHYIVMYRKKNPNQKNDTLEEVLNKDYQNRVGEVLKHFSQT